MHGSEEPALSSDRPIIRRRTTPPIPKIPAPSTSHGGDQSLLDLPLTDTEPEAAELGFARGDSDSGSTENLADSYHPDSYEPGSHEPQVRSPPRSRVARSSKAFERPRGTKRRSPWGGLLALSIAVLAAVPLGIAIGYSLKPQPARPVLSTDLISFGEVIVGQHGQADARLQNDGEADLVVQGWSIIDDPAGAFSLVPSPKCTGIFLKASTACSAKVRYSPISAGVHQARLQLITGPPDALKTKTLPLLGQAIAPELGAEPAILQFNEATVGYRGGRQSVVFQNRGSAPLEVHSIRLQGLGAADFVLTHDLCSRQSLNPESSCEVSFEFVPTTDGERRATVEVSADAPSPSPAPTLIGHGRAQIPLLALQPLRLDFGELRIGQQSNPRRVTLRNDGNSPLDIRSIRVTAPEISAGPGDRLGFQADEIVAGFPFENVDCVGKSLAPEQSCSFLVAFEPRVERPVGALVQIEHSAAASAHRLPLVGTGTAPHLALSPAQLAHGEVAVGRPGAWQSLDLKNTGTADLEVERLRLLGTDARHFELSADGCTRAPIPPGQSCSAQIRFRPRRDGPHRAELEVIHSADDRRDRVSVNGIGTSARLSIEPQSLDFSSVRQWQQRTLSLVLRNAGRAPLTIQSMTITGPIAGDVVLTQSCAERVLEAGRSCVAQLRFSPSRAGALSGKLKIRTDQGSEPQEVELRGTALQEADS